MKTTIYILIFLMSVVLLNAQQPGSLRVNVYSETESNPLANATVGIGSLKLFTTTDKSGTGELFNIPPGEYEISVSFIGYASIKRFVRIRSAANSEIFILKGEAIPLEQITVSATRGIERETPVTFSNIGDYEIGKLTGGNDLTYALSTLPSITFHSENGNGIGYSYIRLRGFDQKRISVLINGIPQNDPEEHSVYWINVFDLAGSLEDAQVQRGAGATFYGPPSIGGSINLITGTGGDVPSLTTEIGIGSFNTQRLSLSGSSGMLFNHVNLYGRVSRVTSDGYRNWSWSKFWKFFISASYVDQIQSLKFNFHGGPQRDGLAFYGIPKSYNQDSELRKYNYGEISRDREYLNSPQFSLLHDVRLSDKVNLHNTFFYFSGDGFFDFDGSWGTHDYLRLDTSLAIPGNTIVRAYVDNDQFGWLPRIEVKYGSGKIITGLEIRKHDSFHWGRIESGEGLPVTGESAPHFYEYKGSKEIYSAYINYLSSLTDSWTLLTDIQAVYQKYRLYDEMYRSHDFSTPYLFLNPKVGLNFNLNEQVSFYTSAALTHREPPLKNLYEAESASWGVEPQFETGGDGNYDYTKPLVRNERLLNFELGHRFSAPAFKVNANLYWMEFENEIVPSGGLDVYGQPRVGNAEKTRHIGFEFEGRYRIFTGIDLHTNVNLSRNRYIRFTEYDAAGLPVNRNGNYIANAPELIFNSSVVYNFDRYYAGIFFKYNGEQYTDNSQNPDSQQDDGVVVDAFPVFDIRAGYSFPLFSVKVNLLGEILNVLNKKYLMTGFGRDNFFPAAGRSYFMTLKLVY
ncbi:MAG: TonB-dependent receptor [Ignavibacteriaceae bacterium]